MTIGKKELVETIASKAELSKHDATAALEAMLEAIEENLCKGNSVGIKEFGTFESRYRAARQGINPQTKATLEIKAQYGAGFKPSKKLNSKLTEALPQK